MKKDDFVEFLRTNKAVSFGAADALLTAASFFLAFLLRFEGDFPPEYRGVFSLALPLIVALNLAFLLRFRLYSFTWAFVGLTELTRLLQALTSASVLFGALILLDRETADVFAGFPRSVVVINYFLNLVLIGGVRIAKRSWEEFFASRAASAGGIKAIVVGAGPEGEQIIRSLLQSKDHRFELAGIVDHNAKKRGTLIHGIKVLGHIDDIPALKEELGIEGLIIALGEQDAAHIKRAVEHARNARIAHVKIIPQFSELLGQRISFEILKDISVEDLLSREPVKIDTGAIERSVTGKKILVTGAAGSIGSEICRQLAHFSPKELIFLDFNESGLFDLEAEFKMQFPGQRVRSVIANIVNDGKMWSVLAQARPDVVFHAAAYKHVPLMEDWPDEAVATNIFGTYVTAEAARAAGVKKFVLISTDKAVKPTSVMGKTKRAAELIVQALDKEGPTRFVAVRFGNVLASRGSVVPLFQEQIRRRAPITVTHPEMTRYFMTIPEAALLVMEAGAVGKGGEVFILDMGEPVKIVDLAKELIRLSGLEPDKDVPIIFTEPRPGEKIFEELLTEEEKRAGATKWQKIFISKTNSHPSLRTIERKLKTLAAELKKPGAAKKAIDRFLA